jgi:hypothetical protein
MNSIDTLLVFGDSWPHGFGLNPDQKTFGQLLAESMNIKNFKNFAIPGTSNSRNLWELMQVLDSIEVTSTTLAVFFITAPGRNMFVQWDNKIIDINMTHTNIDDIVNPVTLNEIYYKYLHSGANEEFDLKRNILALQRICEQKQIKDFYIAGWNELNFDCPGIDNNKIYKQTCAQILGYKNQQDYLTSEPNQYCLFCKHPNQEGHKLIADTLFTWINA